MPTFTAPELTTFLVYFAILIVIGVWVYQRTNTLGDFLLGGRFSAADVCAFPFLKYALLHDPAIDDHRRHTEDHTEQGQKRAQFVRPDRIERQF
jgi:glutathione S-transferase